MNLLRTPPEQEGFHRDYAIPAGPPLLPEAGIKVSGPPPPWGIIKQPVKSSCPTFAEKSFCTGGTCP